MQRMNRYRQLAALAAAFAALGISGAACGGEDQSAWEGLKEDAREAREEVSDEMKDARKQIEDEIDDHTR